MKLFFYTWQHYTFEIHLPVEISIAVEFLCVWVAICLVNDGGDGSENFQSTKNSYD